MADTLAQRQLLDKTAEALPVRVCNFLKRFHLLCAAGSARGLGVEHAKAIVLGLERDAAYAIFRAVRPIWALESVDDDIPRSEWCRIVEVRKTSEPGFVREKHCGTQRVRAG